MQTAEYATMFRVEETHWWYRALHRLIFSFLDEEIPDWREKKILDAGCGTGAVLKRLGNPERNRGIDLSAEAISYCQQRSLTNVRQADILALPFEDASFDIVICSSVLCSLRVPIVRDALRELHRVLAPGGHLILNAPAFEFLRSAHDEAVMTARRFTRGGLRAELVNAGFGVRRLTYWTTFLFPLAVIARTFGGSKTGQDLSASGALAKTRNWIFGKVMALEIPLVRRVSMPFGVGLFAVAQKRS